MRPWRNLGSPKRPPQRWFRNDGSIPMKACEPCGLCCQLSRQTRRFARTCWNSSACSRKPPNGASVSILPWTTEAKVSEERKAFRNHRAIAIKVVIGVAVVFFLLGGDSAIGLFYPSWLLDPGEGARQDTF